MHFFVFTPKIRSYRVSKRGGGISTFIFKIGHTEFFSSKGAKIGRNRDFNVMAVRNTGFWEVHETPYIIHG